MSSSLLYLTFISLAYLNQCVQFVQRRAAIHDLGGQLYPLGNGLYEISCQQHSGAIEEHYVTHRPWLTLEYPAHV